MICIRKHRITFLWNFKNNHIYRFEGNVFTKTPFALYTDLMTQTHFKKSQDEKLMAFPASKTKITLLYHLDHLKPKFYANVDIFGEINNKLVDFEFFKDRNLIALSKNGNLFCFEVSKGKSVLTAKLSLLEPTDVDVGVEMAYNIICCPKGRFAFVSTRINTEACRMFLLRLEPLSIVYSQDSKLDIVKNSYLRSVHFMYLKSKKRSIPLLFVFPCDEPKAMLIFEARETHFKKICTIDTLHRGSLRRVVRTRFHLIGIDYRGGFNALQVR